MAAMRKNLFLYLAIVCFISLIAIFYADGYLGIYDTLYVTVGEREEKIDPDFWLYRDTAVLSESSPAYYIYAQWGQTIFFRYEIDNRQFSTYSTPIQVSVWKENEKVSDLFSGDISIKPFDKVTTEWVLSNEDLGKAEFGDDRYTLRYTVKINFGATERRMVLDLYY
jgi:hypothetical protein